MNDLETWLYLDGPEPDLLRPALHELSAAEPTPEEEERMVRGALARLDARLSSRGLSAAVLLEDADVEPAPPTPGAPDAVRVPCVALADAPPPEKKEEAPAPPVVARRASPLAETANSLGAARPLQPALSASGVRPAPEVRVAGAGEHARTAQLPVMDPTQGARQAAPALTLHQYVSYLTELEVWPELSVKVHERYGVATEAAYHELLRSWDRDLAAAPAMRALAESMRLRYREQARTMRRERSGGG